MMAAPHMLFALQVKRLCPHPATAAFLGVLLLAALGLPRSARAQEAPESAPASPPSSPAVEPETQEEPSGAPVARWSLEALAQRTRQSPALNREREAEMERTRWQQYRAQRAWWPKVEASLLLAPVPEDADPTRLGENIDEILDLSLGPYIRQSTRVVVPVYTFGRMRLARELAEVGVDVARWQREQAFNEHLWQLHRAYFGLQMAQAFQEILAEGDELVTEQLERMEEARDFGDEGFDIADYRRLQIFRAELDGLLLDNARLGDLAQAGLRYLASLDPGPVALEPIVLDELEPLQGLEHYWSVARERRPEIALLDRGLKARKMQVELRRREFYPNLFVAGDFAFGWSTEDAALQPILRCPAGAEDRERCIRDSTLFARPYSNPFDTLSVGVALGLNWRLDLAQQYGELQEARAQAAQLEAQRERALGAMRLEFEQQWREARDARERAEIQTRRLDAARRWRNQFGLRQNMAGEVAIKDALEPLKAYYDARRQLIQAVGEYRIARATLARACGVQTLP